MRIAALEVPAEPQNLVPHGASIATLFATIMGWLPGVIALVPAVYYLILIYESKTVQKWVSRRRAQKLARRLHAKKSKC